MKRDGDACAPRIGAAGLRVDFEDNGVLSRLVVPLILPVGAHRNVILRIRPRADVTLQNEVDVGDAFRTTFTRSHTSTGGGSFFVSASHGRTYGRTEKPYDVIHLEDLRGVRFRLVHLDVDQEPVSLHITFSIAAAGNNVEDDYLAEIELEVKGMVVDAFRVPREVHPNAGKVLLVSGYSAAREQEIFRYRSPQHKLAGKRLKFLQISELHRPTLNELRSLAADADGLHVFTNVDRGKILVEDSEVDPSQFFRAIDGLGLKFVYLATCNSVQIVSSFRNTDIAALIAATENLEEGYAEAFEKWFYEALGTGASISEAFDSADRLTRGYNRHSMFLDVRSDVDFSVRSIRPQMGPGEYPEPWHEPPTRRSRRSSG